MMKLRPQSALRTGWPPKSYAAGEIAGLSRAILAIYSYRDIESFRRAAPGIFLELIPADYFSLADARVDVEKRSVEIIDLWESQPRRVGEHRLAFERNLFDHPFVKHGLEHGLPGPLKLSDFLTLPQLRRTRLYREALAPVGIGRVLSVGSLSGPGLAALSLSRPESAPDFSERDRRALAMLSPHFDQARTNLERETLLRANRRRSLAAYGLTPREAEVALWLAQGKSNPDIATIMATPVRTIEKHVERILRKMGAGNRAAAALTVSGIVRA
jgi:DNA-binding CsgD family transcriptional regulator